MTNVVLIGAGGHSKVIQEILTANNNLTLYAVLDQNIKQRYTDNGIIYGHTGLVDEFVKNGFPFCIAIGNNNIRKKLIEQFSIPANQYISLIHPTSTISPKATIGVGTVVMPHTVINADTVIGKHAIVNSGAVIEHDNNLEDFVHISPNATLAGTVTVGEGSHIGSGATVIPGQTVGKWSTVAAGAVVVNDIDDKTTVVGVPAKPVIREMK